MRSLLNPVAPAPSFSPSGGNPEEQRRSTLIFPLHLKGGRSVGCAVAKGASPRPPSFGENGGIRRDKSSRASITIKMLTMP